MNKKDYDTHKLLETLFGTGYGYKFQNLNEEERSALLALNYSPIDWDILLNEGKATKDDIHKRVAIFKQLKAMDEELQNRKSKKEPKFKRGDLLKRKNNEIVFVTGCVQKSNDFQYVGVVDDGGIRYVTEDDVSQVLMSTK